MLEDILAQVIADVICIPMSVVKEVLDPSWSPLAASGSLHSIAVFVRYENVIRLLEFLGYQLE